MKQKRNHIIQIICAGILTVSLGGLGVFYARLARENASYQALSKQLNKQAAKAGINTDINTNIDTDIDTHINADINTEYTSTCSNASLTIEKSNLSFSNPSEEEKALQNKYSGFISLNPDFIGWLHIDGTKIDYPVMMKPEDPDYYLHRDFSGKDSKSGTPYIGNGCTPDSDNVIIYGHNMKNVTMFADLLKYADEKFYREHPAIQLDLVHKTSSNSQPIITSETYQIIAVFREQIHYQDEVNVFRYYNYCGELSPRSYNDYIQKIKSISLYDTGHSASYGQQLITLSTCSYHVDNGRFVVVAVQTPAKDLLYATNR